MGSSTRASSSNRVGLMVMALHRLQRVSSDYLITLVVVAETGNLSEAAQLLGISQPAVSQQIKSLSLAVGERLHERSGHGVSLTAAGQQLAAEASPLLRGFRGVLGYLHSLEKGDAGHLTIAASNTIAAHILPGWLIGFRKRFPGVRVTARSTNSELVIAALKSGEAEMGLIESPEPIAKGMLTETVIGGDELILACSPRLKTFHSPNVVWEDIEALPMIWRELGSGVRLTVESAMIRAGYHPRTVFELAGGEAVKEAVVAGLGVGYLSSLAIGREVGEKRLLPLKLHGLGSLKRSFRLACRPYEDLSIPSRNFYNLITQ